MRNSTLAENTSSNPLVSVCIPSYNSADFIEETIRSVLSQTYPNIEIIITDDASTDDTVKIIEELRAISPLPMIVKFLENNLGIEGNWNVAISHASGDYIKLLPADDTLDPECIATQLAQFTRYGDRIALTFSARNIITRTGKHLMTARFYNDEYIDSRQLVKRCIIAGTNVIGEPGAVLFPRTLALTAGKFNGQYPYVIDLDFWLRLLEHGDAVAIRTALSTFRIDQNLSVRIGWGRCSQYLSFIKRIADRWSFSAITLNRGRFRTVVNEFLRRGVHFIFKLIG